MPPTVHGMHNSAHSASTLGGSDVADLLIAVRPAW